MLIKEGCSGRRAALSKKFSELDLLIVSRPQHVFYFTGYYSDPTELRGWGLSFVVIDRSGQCTLIVDNWSEGVAAKSYPDSVSVFPWYDFSGPPEDQAVAAIAALSKFLNQKYPSAKNIALEASHLPSAALSMCGISEASDLGPHIMDMRNIKYPDELVCIRRAIRATENGHSKAREVIRPGLTEMEVYTEVQKAITSVAGQPIIMLGDFAGGIRTEDAGGPPTDRILKEQDLMIFDIFPIIGGYRADFTNTLCAGTPTSEQLDLMNVLKNAMAAGEAQLVPGKTGGEVYSAVKKVFFDAGWEKEFFHHAGHGLGLGHPEAPYLVSNCRQPIVAGQVITLEPGAYRKGFGGARIENDYLITDQGPEKLSNHQIGL